MYIFLSLTLRLRNDGHVLALRKNFVAYSAGHPLSWNCKNVRQLFRIYYGIDLYPEKVEEFRFQNPLSKMTKQISNYKPQNNIKYNLVRVSYWDFVYRPVHKNIKKD
jgi:hypothetical protein